METYGIAQRETRDGEALLWAGRPDPAALARRRWPVAVTGLFLLAFTVAWSVGAAEITAIVWRDGGAEPFDAMLRDSVLPAAALANSVLALAMLSAPLWAALGAGRTVYAVTDRRAMIVRGRRVDSCAGADMTSFLKWERGDGSGDIVFRESAPPAILALFALGMPSRTGFFGVPQLRRVEHHLQRLKHGVAADGPAARRRARAGPSAPAPDAAATRILRAELDLDEVLAWAGRPAPGIAVRRYLIHGLFGAVLATFPTAMSLTAPVPALEMVPLLPFWLLGGALFSVPVFASARARARLYLITDRRAAIIDAFPRRCVRSFHASDLDAISRGVYGYSGRADVMFASIPANLWLLFRLTPMLWRVPTERTGFVGIADHDRAAALLRKLARS